MSLFTFIMKLAIPIPKILNHQSYAFIGAHPDDIEVGCGPTVAKLSAMGKRICFIIATDGRYGTFDSTLDRDELIKTRQEEAIQAAAVLGVNDIRFLGFPDGGDYNVKELKNKIAIELADFKPDMIFTIDNHIKSELHPDHIQTGQATETALLTCQFPLMMRDLGSNEVAKPKGIAYYYTDKPNRYVRLNGKLLKKRVEALEQHKSQFLPDEETAKLFRLLQFYFKLTAVRFGIRRLTRYADGYRVLSVLHTHCAPDASKF